MNKFNIPEFRFPRANLPYSIALQPGSSGRSDYVQEGLIACWDYRKGIGVDVDGNTTWKPCYVTPAAKDEREYLTLRANGKLDTSNGIKFDCTLTEEQSGYNVDGVFFDRLGFDYALPYGNVVEVCVKFDDNSIAFVYYPRFGENTYEQIVKAENRIVFLGGWSLRDHNCYEVTNLSEINTICTSFNEKLYVNGSEQIGELLDENYSLKRDPGETGAIGAMKGTIYSIRIYDRDEYTEEMARLNYETDMRSFGGKSPVPENALYDDGGNALYDDSGNILLLDI